MNERISSNKSSTRPITNAPSPSSPKTGRLDGRSVERQTQSQLAKEVLALFENKTGASSGGGSGSQPLQQRDVRLTEPFYMNLQTTDDGYEWPNGEFDNGDEYEEVDLGQSGGGEPIYEEVNVESSSGSANPPLHDGPTSGAKNAPNRPAPPPVGTGGTKARTKPPVAPKPKNLPSPLQGMPSRRAPLAPGRPPGKTPITPKKVKTSRFKTMKKTVIKGLKKLKGLTSRKGIRKAFSKKTNNS